MTHTIERGGEREELGVASASQPPLSHPFGAEPVPVSGKAGIANADQASLHIAAFAEALNMKHRPEGNEFHELDWFWLARDEDDPALWQAGTTKEIPGGRWSPPDDDPIDIGEPTKLSEALMLIAEARLNEEREAKAEAEYYQQMHDEECAAKAATPHPTGASK